jgi:hypothetical protein
MALHVQLQQDVYSFHLTYYLPFKEMKKSKIEEVISIYADGQELQHICFKFKNIVMLNIYEGKAPAGFGFTWYGDLAKKILANL